MDYDKKGRCTKIMGLHLSDSYYKKRGDVNELNPCTIITTDSNAPNKFSYNTSDKTPLETMPINELQKYVTDKEMAHKKQILDGSTVCHCANEVTPDQLDVSHLSSGYFINPVDGFIYNLKTSIFRAHPSKYSTIHKVLIGKKSGSIKDGNVEYSYIDSLFGSYVDLLMCDVKMLDNSDIAEAATLSLDVFKNHVKQLPNNLKKREFVSAVKKHLASFYLVLKYKVIPKDVLNDWWVIYKSK